MLKSLKKQTPKEFFKMVVKEYSFILSLILLLVIATCVNPNFFSWTNITNPVSYTHLTLPTTSRV